MIKIFATSFLIFAVLGSVYAGNILKGQKQVQKQEYRPGILVVQYKAEATASPNFKIAMDANGIAHTGIGSLDNIHRQASVRSVSREDLYTPKNKILTSRLGVDRIYLLKVPPSTDIVTLAQHYAQDPNVEFANPDWKAYPDVIPNDPLYPNQWGHNNTAQMPSYNWSAFEHNGPPVGTVGFDANAEAAWGNSQGFGSSSIAIAIIDGGVEWAHPDLSANIWTNPGETGGGKETNGIDDDGNGKIDDWHGWDFGDNDNNPDDNSSSPGHGTACAGITAAVANNNLGVAGIAAGCKIMALKGANSAGTLFYSYINNAIYYAADNGAKVISMSFSSTSQDAANQTACTYAWNAGSVPCAATSNYNLSTIGYPAGNTNVVGVGAASNCGDRKRSSSNPSELNPGVAADPNGYTCDGERWWGSNYGSTTKDAATAVDVIAPTILPTTDRVGANGYDPGDYDLYFNGTSCATPYAAGVCGLIFSKNPSWTASQVRNQLCNTAQDIVNVESVGGWDRYSGYGMVDAAAGTGGGAPADTIPPVISNVQASSIGANSAVITWTTDELSNSVVDYGLTASYGSSASNAANVTSHSITLSSLSANTLYHYRVKSTDPSNNTATGVDHTFQTGGSFSYAPTSTTIIQGSLNSGSFSNLATNNASYYVVNSTTSGNPRTTNWYGSVTVSQAPASITSLTVTYDGKYSRTNRTQILYLYNWVSASWTQIDSRTVGTTDVTISNTQTSPANFISGSGEIRLRVNASTGNKNFTCSGDYMQFTVGTAGVSLSKQIPIVITENAAPTEYALMQNYPNPFNPSTNFAFQVAEFGHVKLVVYDVLGREVATIVNEDLNPGEYNRTWNANGIPSGVYYFRLTAGSFSEVKKMMLLK